MSARHSKRVLRGKRLEEAAIRELGALDGWTTGEELSWSVLAIRLGCSRQALEAKPSVVDAYWVAKQQLASDRSTTPAAVLRRTERQRIAELEDRLREKERQIDAWLEKWATVEYNCRTFGFDPDKILQPLVKPNRVAI